MYIGPWQEFKLAKILQIKDKMEKEEEAERQSFARGGGPGSPNLSYQHAPKAYSMNGAAGMYHDDATVSNFSGYSHPAYGANNPYRIMNAGSSQYSNYTHQPNMESDSLRRARQN